MTQSSNIPSAAVDPVCGRNVDPRKTRFTTGTGEGIRYFCSENCLHRFTAPGEKTASAAKRGFWARYLDRLNKSTGGKPPSCCG